MELALNIVQTGQARRAFKRRARLSTAPLTGSTTNTPLEPGVEYLRSDLGARRRDKAHRLTKRRTRPSPLPVEPSPA
jgi:hypothetical protein